MNCYIHVYFNFKLNTNFFKILDHKYNKIRKQSVRFNVYKILCLHFVEHRGNSTTCSYCAFNVRAFIGPISGSVLVEAAGFSWGSTLCAGVLLMAVREKDRESNPLAADLQLSGKFFVDRPVCQQNFFRRATVLQLLFHNTSNRKFILHEHISPLCS